MAIEPMGPVVVGVDGSAMSLAALDLAADEAAARVTPLVVVHGSDRPARRSAEQLLDTAVARVRSEHPGLAVAGDSVPGDAAAALLDWARHSCLVVVGHRGHCAAGDLLLGSVAIQVIDQADVPVIVHRPVDTSTDVALPRPVLAGISADTGSDVVVEFAFGEASLRGAPLHAMYVWSVSDAAEDAALRPEVEGFEQGQLTAERMLAEALAGWSEKYPDVSVRRTVRHSLDVAVALTAASRSAQLAVVGSSRGSGPSLLAGSVTHALVHRAGCPVAAIKAG